MNSDSASTFPDKEQLRQHEIAAQIAALHAPLANARIAAARRLGEMRAGLDALLAALHDPNEQVRTAAAMALGSFAEDPRQPVIADDLLSAIDDPSERVCQAAIRSLGMLKAHAAGPEIEAFLEDPNVHIVGAAVLALARLTGPSEKERAALGRQLVPFLSHQSTYVRTQAVRALAHIHHFPAGPQMIQMLQTAREERQAVQQHDLSGIPLDFRADPHYALENQLVRAAGELRLQDAVPILLEIAQKDIGLRGLAVEALIAIGAEIQPEMLAGLLHDPSVFLRRRLISLMAQANYTPALPLLRGLLKDDSVTTRGAALQALTLMRDREALPAIAWIVQYDSNPFLRVQALGSLVTLQSTEALPLLLALSNDSNFEIRRMIAGYLLDWALPDQKSLVPMARFLRDFPDDERSPRIQAFLESRGFDLTCVDALTDSISPENYRLPASGDLPLEIRAEAEGLLYMLQRWRMALPPSSDRTAAALEHLIEMLKPDQGEE